MPPRPYCQIESFVPSSAFGPHSTAYWGRSTTPSRISGCSWQLNRYVNCQDVMTVASRGSQSARRTAGWATGAETASHPPVPPEASRATRRTSSSPSRACWPGRSSTTERHSGELIPSSTSRVRSTSTDPSAARRPYSTESASPSERRPATVKVR